MRSIDIRSEHEELISQIRVADVNHIWNTIDVIDHEGDYIKLRDSQDGASMSIRSTKQLDDLIKGLLKAKELGWFKNGT